MNFLETQDKIRRLYNAPVDVYALAKMETLKNDTLLNPRKHAVWKSLMRADQHARYFSTFNRFAGILGQSAFERQMEFAEKLQRMQPLLNPEYIRLTSWLAKQDEYASAIEAIVIPLPKIDNNILANPGKRKTVVKETLKTNEELLIQNQKLAIDYHNTDSNWFNWRELANKPSYFIALFELMDWSFGKLVNELDANIISENISTIKALVFVYILLEALVGAFNHDCGKNTD